MLSHRFNYNLLVLSIMIAYLLVIDRLKHIVPLLIWRLKPRPHLLKPKILVAHIDFVFLLFVLFDLIETWFLVQSINLFLRLPWENRILPFKHFSLSHRCGWDSLDRHLILLLSDLFNEGVHVHLVVFLDHLLDLRRVKFLRVELLDVVIRYFRVLYVEILLHQAMSIVLDLGLEGFLFREPGAWGVHVVVHTQDSLVWVCRDIVKRMVGVRRVGAHVIEAVTWVAERRLSVNNTDELILIANFPNLVVLKRDRTARLV